MATEPDREQVEYPPQQTPDAAEARAAVASARPGAGAVVPN